MENIVNVAGLINFVLYFGGALIFLLAFKYLGLWVTPYDEWKLIKEEQNLAAALALSGSLIGYTIAISGVASSSVNFIDFIIWGLISAVTQFLAMLIVRKVFMPDFVQRIENNEVPASVMAASFYIAIGILNAACTSY